MCCCWTLHEWGHTCGLLRLAPFTWQDVFRGSRTLTPLPFALAATLWCEGVYGCLFTCSATDGHLGYSCLSAVVNVSIRVHMCVWESFLLPLGVQLGVELLDHMVTVFNLLRNCGLFSKAPTPFDILISSTESF